MATRTRTVIVSEDDETNLATLSGKFPLVSGHKLAQAAYRYGLRACVRCPDLVLEEARLVNTEASR